MLSSIFLALFSPGPRRCILDPTLHPVDATPYKHGHTHAVRSHLTWPDVAPDHSAAAAEAPNTWDAVWSSVRRYGAPVRDASTDLERIPGPVACLHIERQVHIVRCWQLILLGIYHPWPVAVFSPPHCESLKSLNGRWTEVNLIVLFVRCCACKITLSFDIVAVLGLGRAPFARSPQLQPSHKSELLPCSCEETLTGLLQD